MSAQQKLRLGWREWVGLPSLGLPAIKAKIDTGARTSTLHAFKPKVFRDKGEKFIRFRTHPIQKNADCTRECVAKVVDRRFVTDSGGKRELRYIIRVPVEVEGKSWEVEVSLTNRKKMRFRMLLGRTALEGCTIEPDASFLTGRITRKKLAKVYDL